MTFIKRIFIGGFLFYRNRKARIVLLSSNNRIVSKMLYIIFKFRTFLSLILKNGNFSKFDVVSVPVFKVGNAFFRGLIDKYDDIFPNISRRNIVFDDEKHTQVFCDSFKIFFPNGSSIDSEYSIETTDSNYLQFNHVTFHRFRYIYDENSIYLHRQFISEFEDTYYGRSSDVFFSKQKLVAFGHFPIKHEKMISGSVHSIFGPYYNNYWHFLIEYLPKFLLVPKFSKILVPKNLKYIEILQRVLKTRNLEIVYLDPLKVYKFETLIVYSSPISQFGPSHILVDHNLILKFRDFLNSFFQKEQFTRLQISRIFIARNSHNRVYLDKNLKKYFSRLGFDIFDFAQISFYSQVKLVSQARLVCSYAGAVWANLLFANRESIFINFVDYNNSQESLHQVIAKLFDLNFITYSLQSIPSSKKNNERKFFNLIRHSKKRELEEISRFVLQQDKT